MVVGIFPIAKLGLLAIKHISKPIGNLLKQTAKKNQAFKRFVVMPPAHLYHVIDVRSKMWMLGMRQPSVIPPLTDAMTIQMGSDILSEVAILIIGTMLIMSEVMRQGKKDKLKHERHRTERARLGERIVHLTEKVSKQEWEIKKLKAIAQEM
ncbi:hypothetical protein KR018_012625 [Drosophila ironensis]|nr:hypothetical protein KR018_012625 [Drosophila ironensis]